MGVALSISPSATVTDDEEIVRWMQRISLGDEQAFEQLVQHFQHELTGYFFNQCWDQHVAEELAQTVFIKIYRARERYKPTASVRTYLYRIARNAWIDHLRRRKQHASLDAGSEDGFALRDQIEGGIDAALPGRLDDIQARIAHAVEQLPVGQREVFVLANQQELPYPEISDILGIPVGTVKSRMYHAVRALRTDLADLHE